jgi:hypothetical protein
MAGPARIRHFVPLMFFVQESHSVYSVYSVVI